MIYRYILAFLLLFILNSCVPRGFSYESIYDDIEEQHLAYVKNNYGFWCYGKGGSFHEKIYHIDIYLKSCKTMSLNNARLYIIKSTQDFLRRINQSDRLCVYLLENPFTSKGLTYNISTLGADGYFQRSVNLDETDRIASVSCSFGVITYSIVLESERGLKHIHEETYEEAVEILRQQGCL